MLCDVLVIGNVRVVLTILPSHDPPQCAFQVDRFHTNPAQVVLYDCPAISQTDKKCHVQGHLPDLGVLG